MVDKVMDFLFVVTMIIAIVAVVGVVSAQEEEEPWAAWSLVIDEIDYEAITEPVVTREVDHWVVEWDRPDGTHWHARTTESVVWGENLPYEAPREKGATSDGKS